MTFDEKQAKNLCYKKTSEGNTLLPLQPSIWNQYLNKLAEVNQEHNSVKYSQQELREYL